MSTEKDDLDHLIDHMAAWLKQPVSEDWRPGIRQHLQSARIIVGDVLSFDLADDAEAAPVYVP